MATRIVTATGGTGAGTIGDPWSINHARVNAQPGDLVQLRSSAGVYEMATAGLNITADGSADNRITFEPYPGETPRISGAVLAYTIIGNSAWELYDGPTETYRTVASNLGVDTYRGHVQKADGDWHPLVTHKTLAGLMAATGEFRMDGNYYMGPGIVEDTVSGRLYIRLQDPDPVPMYGRVPPIVTNKDPRQNDIRISGASMSGNNPIGLKITGDYITWRGIDVDDFATRTTVLGLNDTIEDCGGRFGYFGIRLSNSVGCTMTGVTVDGLLYNDRMPMAWEDVKAGAVNADAMRKCGLDTDISSGWTFTGGSIRNVFDAVLGSSTHDYQLTDNLIQSWDDFWQLFATNYRGDVLRNRVYGGGIGHDSSGSNNINADPATVYVGFNRFRPKLYPLLWGRIRAAGSPAGNVGFKDPFAITAHGQAGAGRWPSPWKFYQNTVEYGNNTGSSNLDYFSAHSAEHQYDAPITNDVFNNIIIVNNAPLGSRFHSATGRERYDGNVLWGFVGNGPIYRLIYTSGPILDGEAPIGSLNLLSEMKASIAFTDSKLYYSPGWENSGLQVDPQLDENMRPANPLCHTGAVDLTDMGLPGYDVHLPYRGAVDPLVRSKYTVTLSFT